MFSELLNKEIRYRISLRGFYTLVGYSFGLPAVGNFRFDVKNYSSLPEFRTEESEHKLVFDIFAKI